MGAGQRNNLAALIVATASFDDPAAIARLLVASAVGSIVLMMIGGLASAFPTTALTRETRFKDRKRFEV